MHTLTPAETAVAQCIASGMSDAEILAAKSMTVYQLRTAIKSLYRKSGAQCVRAFVVWCQGSCMSRNCEVGPSNLTKGR